MHGLDPAIKCTEVQKVHTPIAALRGVCIYELVIECSFRSPGAMYVRKHVR